MPSLQNRLQLTGGRASYLFLLGLLGCSGDPTATDPVLVFADGFQSSIEQVEIVADGGTITGGFNAWLKLLPRGRLQLRHETDFTDRDCTAAVEWFQHAMQSRELDLKNGGLVCLEYVNNAFNYPNGRWLIEDRNTGYVYYRVWKSY